MRVSLSDRQGCRSFIATSIDRKPSTILASYNDVTKLASGHLLSVLPSSDRLKLSQISIKDRVFNKISETTQQGE